MSAILKAKLVAENIKPKIGSRILNSKQELLGGELACSRRRRAMARTLPRSRWM
jgi:hypothetical protein